MCASARHTVDSAFTLWPMFFFSVVRVYLQMGKIRTEECDWAWNKSHQIVWLEHFAQPKCDDFFQKKNCVHKTNFFYMIFGSKGFFFQRKMDEFMQTKKHSHDLVLCLIKQFVRRVFTQLNRFTR